MESKEYTWQQKEDAELVRFALAVSKILNTTQETQAEIKRAIRLIFSPEEQKQNHARDYLESLYWSKT